MVLEAMEPYWRAIGVQVTIKPVDFGAFVTSPWTSGDAHGVVWISRNRPIRTTQGYLEAWHTDAVRLRAYVDNYLETAIVELSKTFDLEQRDQMAREIGNHLYERFVQINLGATYEEMTVNPKFVPEWVFPGTTPTGYTHYHMIKRAQEGERRIAGGGGACPPTAARTATSVRRWYEALPQSLYWLEVHDQKHGRDRARTNPFRTTARAHSRHLRATVLAPEQHQA